MDKGEEGCPGLSRGSKSAEALSLNVTHNLFDDIRNFCRNFLSSLLIRCSLFFRSIRANRANFLKFLRFICEKFVRLSETEQVKSSLWVNSPIYSWWIQWRDCKCAGYISGGARNFWQGVRLSVAFLPKHIYPCSAALPSRPYHRRARILSGGALFWPKSWRPFFSRRPQRPSKYTSKSKPTQQKLS